jgi:hypothetical protein
MELFVVGSYLFEATVRLASIYIHPYYIPEISGCGNRFILCD